MARKSGENGSFSIASVLSKSRRGLTLVEALVVFAVIGVLISLLLPAIGAAREAARRGSCANNLKQIAFAVKLHENAHKFFPTGGWGGDYVGDPDGGFGIEQPGGWVYNSLPYVEQSDLREIGAGLPTSEKRRAMQSVLQTPLELFYCPSRRQPVALPFVGRPFRNAETPKDVAKSDYAINAALSGVKTQVALSYIQLDRGLSRTVMAGEKSLAQVSYTTGQGVGDGSTLYAGDCTDTRRDAGAAVVPDTQSAGTGFGGPHRSGCNIVFCDASVKFILDFAIIEPD